MRLTSVEVVQRQVEAYNRRDLEAFVALFHPEVLVYRLPALQPAISGRAALREFYATHRFNRQELHAEIVQRVVLGNTVFDHERVSGVTATAMEMMAVYEVSAGLIVRVWFFAPG
jgi:hypothetical protein